MTICSPWSNVEVIIKKKGYKKRKYKNNCVKEDLKALGMYIQSTFS